MKSCLTDYPVCLHQVRVDPEWADYNEHLTESRYLQIFSDATDELYQYIGVNQAYRDSGSSYFTVDTYIAHKGEVMVNEKVRVTTEVHGFDEKRIHLLHKMFHVEGGDYVAKCEQILLHVDLKKRRASSAQLGVLDKLSAIYAMHLDSPEALRKQVLLLGFRMEASEGRLNSN